jgi:hypothetical protein
MGDLLFKVAPAVLSPVPDISFIEILKGWEYVGVLATDGVWDHLKHAGMGVATQCERVAGVLVKAVEKGHEEEEEEVAVGVVGENVSVSVSGERGVEEVMSECGSEVSSTSSLTAVSGTNDVGAGSLSVKSKKYGKEIVRPTKIGEPLRERLGEAAKVLVERVPKDLSKVPEYLKESVDDLYYRVLDRYDDCSALVFLLRG